MKVLILGAAGMLGKALVAESKKRKFTTLAADQHKTPLNFDVTNDTELINTIKKTHPDILINTISIVNHNECESNPGKAYLVNARPASIIARLAKELSFYNIHISTDHFYTNEKNKKHTETNPVCLLNEYARTKYVGEQFALTYPNSLVIRTNIVGFRQEPERPTFVEWVLKTLQENKSITLFNDYYTSSIDVQMFSKILFDVLEKKYIGTLNIASNEVFTKQAFIETIATKFGYTLQNASIGSVHTLPGKRADSCGLDTSKAENLLCCQLPTLEQVAQNLVNEYREKQYAL